jgi:hypothetical protein
VKKSGVGGFLNQWDVRNFGERRERYEGERNRRNRRERRNREGL